MAGRSSSPRAGADTATGPQAEPGREAAQDELIGSVGMKILAAWPRPTRLIHARAGATQGRRGGNGGMRSRGWRAAPPDWGWGTTWGREPQNQTGRGRGRRARVPRDPRPRPQGCGRPQAQACAGSGGEAAGGRRSREVEGRRTAAGTLALAPSAHALARSGERGLTTTPRDVRAPRRCQATGDAAGRRQAQSEVQPACGLRVPPHAGARLGVAQAPRAAGNGHRGAPGSRPHAWALPRGLSAPSPAGMEGPRGGRKAFAGFGVRRTNLGTVAPGPPAHCTAVSPERLRSP